LMVSITVERGGIGVSDVGLRALPALIVFFVVSGFRAAFQFPAELPANWLFKLTESGWVEAARRVARLRVTVSGLLPVMALLAPLEIWRWGWSAGALHLAVQVAAGMLLIEILFYSFDKIPFTCSYYPGGLNLIFLAVAYLYGFTTYSFQIADLELGWKRGRERGAVPGRGGRAMDGAAAIPAPGDGLDSLRGRRTGHSDAGTELSPPRRSPDNRLARLQRPDVDAEPIGAAGQRRERAEVHGDDLLRLEQGAGQRGLAGPMVNRSPTGRMASSGW